MEMKQSVRVNSIEMDEMNKNGQSSTSNELHEFMIKYKRLDKDRKKYMICFFGLFALVIIFLVIILIGITANDNASASNIDTCHSDCTSMENQFVTLTESDTDTPIATYNGWLDVYLQNVNLTNYSRIVSNNGEIINNLQKYLYSLKHNLSSFDGNIYVSVQKQVFQGNVDYEMLVKACNILLTGTKKEPVCSIHSIHVPNDNIFLFFWFIFRTFFIHFTKYYRHCIINIKISIKFTNYK